jgi:hypothetical protein
MLNDHPAYINFTSLHSASYGQGADLRNLLTYMKERLGLLHQLVQRTKKTICVSRHISSDLQFALETRFNSSEQAAVTTIPSFPLLGAKEAEIRFAQGCDVFVTDVAVKDTFSLWLPPNSFVVMVGGDEPGALEPADATHTIDWLRDTPGVSVVTPKRSGDSLLRTLHSVLGLDKPVKPDLGKPSTTKKVSTYDCVGPIRPASTRACHFKNVCIKKTTAHVEATLVFYAPNSESGFSKSNIATDLSSDPDAKFLGPKSLIQVPLSVSDAFFPQTATVLSGTHFYWLPRYLDHFGHAVLDASPVHFGVLDQFNMTPEGVQSIWPDTWKQHTSNSNISSVTAEKVKNVVRRYHLLLSDLYPLELHQLFQGDETLVCFDSLVVGSNHMGSALFLHYPRSTRLRLPLLQRLTSFVKSRIGLDPLEIPSETVVLISNKTNRRRITNLPDIVDRVRRLCAQEFKCTVKTQTNFGNMSVPDQIRAFHNVSVYVGQSGSAGSLQLFMPVISQSLTDENPGPLGSFHGVYKNLMQLQADMVDWTRPVEYDIPTSGVQIDPCNLISKIRKALHRQKQMRQLLDLWAQIRA